MRTNRTLAVAVVAVLSLALAGCGDSGDDTSTGTSDKKSNTEVADSGTTLPDVSDIPDVGDLPDAGDLPDLSDLPEMDGVMGDCIAASAVYSSILSGLTGKELSASDKAQIEELKGEMPDGMQDDLDVITEAMAKIGSEGLVAAGQAMSTPEFTAAQKNVEAYFEEMCKDVSPGG